MRKILLICVFIGCCFGFVFAQERFEEKKFGFSMTKPAKWFEAEKSDLVKNLQKVDISDEKLDKLLKEDNRSILLVAFYKYLPNEHVGLIPKAQVDVRLNPTKTYEQFRSSLLKSMESFKSYFPDFEFLETPKDVEVSSIKSLSTFSKFTVKMENGQSLKARSRTYAIPYKQYFFQISLTDGQNEEDCSKIFDEIVKSIKIGN